MDGNVALALGLTIIAGLSTGIGSAIAYFIRKPKVSYLSFSLGFSAGVMIYVSFAELLPLGIEDAGENWGVAAFFLGILFIAVIDMLIPEHDNPHEFKDFSTEEMADAHSSGHKKDAGRAQNGVKTASDDEDGIKSLKDDGQSDVLMRAGIFTALAIAVHNFPEGLATFATALEDPALGVMIALAIAIHNIPEGISVSVPIYYATGDRKKAFKYSFLSGVAEPVGAVIGFLILMPFLNSFVLGALLAFVAGIMVYISLDEILPMAHRYGHSHGVIVAVVFGMLVMAVSLLML